jgi:hypothetical protein
MSLSALERWYASQCDGEWEHGYGVRIDTLDNPGWRVHIGLHGTKKQDASLARVALTRSQDDWILIGSRNRNFKLHVDPRTCQRRLISSSAGSTQSDKSSSTRLRNRDQSNGSFQSEIDFFSASPRLRGK